VRIGLPQDPQQMMPWHSAEPSRGGATLEDKVVQRAVVEVLNAVYEADFQGFSYGFRPGREPHQALDALAVGIGRRKVNWVLDADIRDFFGQLDRGWLEKFLRHRIADERILRLIGKWLAAGVVEEEVWSEGAGAPQGHQHHRCSQMCTCTTCWTCSWCGGGVTTPAVT
jgi:retron-type reverse transcriptase